MKIYLKLLLVTWITILTSCANVNIPQESVDLSSEVGIGIKKQYQSQIALIDLHFGVKRSELDKAMQRSLSSYFSVIASSDGSVSLTESQFNDLAGFVLILNDKNNKAKEELENVRVLILRELDENYLALNQASSSVTGLLQSAVTLKQARSEAFKKLSESTKGKLDLNKVFSDLDDFVLKSGQDAGKAINLVEKVKPYFE